MNASHKVTVIIPYFGRLPSWLPLWLKSCEQNANYRWVILSDSPDLPKKTPPNVSFHRSSLAEIKSRAESVFGFDVRLETPYKLTDLKVAYGALFPEYIGDSSHWAFSDLDMLYGRLDHFFRIPERNDYVRIFHRGHFSIFKNSEEGNNLFRLTTPEISFRTVMETPDCCYFDEWTGLSKVMEHHGVPAFHEEVIADIEWKADRLRKTKEPNYPLQVFYYEEGAVYQGYWTGTAFERNEWAYIHFQKRPMRPPNFDSESAKSWYVTSTGFREKLSDPGSPADFRLYNPKQVLFPLRFLSRRISGRVKRMLAKGEWNPRI